VLSMSALYPWIVFVHVTAAFTFVLAHGVAVFTGFRVRQERDRARIAALLDLSNASTSLMYGALLVVVAAGLLAGGMGGWLGRLWPWTSIGVLVVVAAAMALIGTGHFTRLRLLVGASISPYQARSLAPAPDPEVAEKELSLRLRSRRPELLAVIGGGGLLIVIWLMVLKPF
jgi:hypothetical protein